MALEPQLLPNNLIPFNSNYAERFIYPPSTQTALTQIAQIYLLQNNVEKAKEYLEKAIIIRENNYQTPCELWAKILENEGNIIEAIKFYKKKIQAMEATKIPFHNGQQAMEYYPIYAPKEEKPKHIYWGEYHRTKIIFLHEYYFRIANAYRQMRQGLPAKKASQIASDLLKKHQ